MGYFVTNKGQGPGSNTGRGANPQLDSALFSFRLLLQKFKLLKGVVRRNTSVDAAGDVLYIICVRHRRMYRFDSCCR